MASTGVRRAARTAGYYLLPRVAKNPFALLASVLFYAWGAPVFVFVVLGSILLDFYIVKVLDKKRGRVKDWLLAASMALNIGLLLYFKYANFFVASAFHHPRSELHEHVAVPIELRDLLTDIPAGTPPIGG